MTGYARWNVSQIIRFFTHISIQREPIESKEKDEEKLGSNWPNLLFVTFKQTNQIFWGAGEEGCMGITV